MQSDIKKNTAGAQTTTQKVKNRAEYSSKREKITIGNKECNISYVFLSKNKPLYTATNKIEIMVDNSGWMHRSLLIKTEKKAQLKGD